MHSNRDLDQIKADIASSKHLARYKSSKAVEDLPGLGEWYCIECSKWFEGGHNLVAHRKGKNHKRRLVHKDNLFVRVADTFLSVRRLMEEAHSQKTAEAAVGLTTDNGSRKEQAMDIM